ncbi:hypothetical protein PIB30_083453 [Stylosanthes scabra]|uniref:Uncharacterized protein n=1 Tax=Stylosanthes scabra TaxID=79078 RepID=A0ABU6YSV7_9FABA|nr:hypothetical protein [Stylosanthes scabra]
MPKRHDEEVFDDRFHGKKGPKWRERAQGKLRRTRKARRMDKSQKPKSALTARPPPLHGAPAPSFLNEEVFLWWRDRTTQMALLRHPIS